jgi:hypothetical protein
LCVFYFKAVLYGLAIFETRIVASYSALNVEMNRRTS